MTDEPKAQVTSGGRHSAEIAHDLERHGKMLGDADIGKLMLEAATRLRDQMHAHENAGCVVYYGKDGPQ